jgi:hypothetical protein
MTTLREGYQAAEEEDNTEDTGDYGAVYGVSSPSQEFEVKLGPEFHYENGKEVYHDADVASGWTYGGREMVASEPGAASQALSGQDDFATRHPGSLVADSAGGSPSPLVVAGNAAFKWATPFNKAIAAGGLKGGISPASSRALASTQTSQTVFPAGSKFPTFKGPSWDEKAIKGKARKAAAPEIGALEMKMQQVMARYYENPNVRRMVLRDTLAGYGIGLANIRAKAEAGARAEYGQEYARMYSEAMNDFNRSLQKLEMQSSKVTTQQPVYTKAALEKLTGKKDNVDKLA